MTGTADIAFDFDSKTELDFRNRLIAKFAIPRATESFWGTGFHQIPEASLYPRGDTILELCSGIKAELKEELSTGDLGLFVKEWSDLESFLLENARRITERNVSIREAIWALAKNERITQETAKELDSLRDLRNAIVHQPGKVNPAAVHTWLPRLDMLKRAVLRGVRR